LLFVFISACAKSNTRLGSEKDAGEESIDDGSALADVDPPVNSESSAGSKASSGGDQRTNSFTGGTNGQGGAWIDALIDAGIDVSSQVDSGSSLPNADWMEDPEIRKARLDLISDYCSLLERFPCLSSEDYYSFVFNTMEERISYCEQREELSFPGHDMNLGQCVSEWEDVLKCAIQYPYSCPCSGSDCIVTPLRDNGNLDSSYPCSESVNALLSCTQSVYDSEPETQWFTVTGERLTCRGSLQPLDEHVCHVSCPIDELGEDDGYYLDCAGPPEGPFECECRVHFTTLRDAYPYDLNAFIQERSTPPLEEIMPDCESATKAMADGMCHDITDCCFTFINDDGSEGCGCTADPTRSLTGAATCEELADALGGEVVDLCPQYKEINSFPPQ